MMKKVIVEWSCAGGLRSLPPAALIASSVWPGNGFACKALPGQTLVQSYCVGNDDQ